MLNNVGLHGQVYWASLTQTAAHLSILEAQKQHFFHEREPGFLRVPLLVVVLFLAAARLVFLAAGVLLLLGGGASNGLGPPLDKARGSLRERSHSWGGGGDGIRRQAPTSIRGRD